MSNQKEKTEECPRCGDEVPISQLKLCLSDNAKPEYYNKKICCGWVYDEYDEGKEP